MKWGSKDLCINSEGSGGGYAEWKFYRNILSLYSFAEKKPIPKVSLHWREVVYGWLFHNQKWHLNTSFSKIV